MDLLVGGFADLRLPLMSHSELEAFAILLEIPDQDILSWVTGQADVPANQDTPLLRELLAFRPVETGRT